MKQHWILVGIVVIVGCVLVFRSRALNPVGPATMPRLNGVDFSKLTKPMKPVDMNEVARLTGVPVSKLKGITVAPTTTPARSILDSLALDLGKPIAPYAAVLEKNVPSELLLIRAQPAVYRILEYGDFDFRIPADVKIDLAAMAKVHDDSSALAALQLASDAARVSDYWNQIVTNADALLSSTTTTSAQSFKDQLMASGTGFLVSRDGTVLTNAHVISDVPDEALSQDPQLLAQQIGPQVDAFIDEAVKTIGGAPTEEQTPAVATAVLQWFARHGRITGTFTRAELALHLDRAKVVAKVNGNEPIDLSSILSKAPVPITCPLTVLAKGEVLPGKDVAVLRAERGGSFDVLDRAVCLPLGDSDEVLPGLRIQAMGFPGVAFNPDSMRPDAEYRVSAADGQIGNTKTMNGGDAGDWDAFEMTANINHGDSGGPVIDPTTGNVVGLNVGAAQEAALVGHSLAVPINIAKVMLKALNITPDPGPATTLWLNGLEKYGKKDYAGAADAFDRLASIQANWQSVEGLPSLQTHPIWDSATLQPSVNPYVTAMLKRAKGKVGQ